MQNKRLLKISIENLYWKFPLKTLMFPRLVTFSVSSSISIRVRELELITYETRN
jgi:hypothetical protein